MFFEQIKLIWTNQCGCTHKWDFNKLFEPTKAVVLYAYTQMGFVQI